MPVPGSFAVLLLGEELRSRGVVRRNVAILFVASSHIKFVQQT